MLPRTLVSLKLNRTDVMVSADVGKVKLDIAALLDSKLAETRAWEWTVPTSFRPILEQCLKPWQKVDPNGGGLLSCKETSESDVDRMSEQLT